MQVDRVKLSGAQEAPLDLIALCLSRLAKYPSAIKLFVALLHIRRPDQQVDVQEYKRVSKNGETGRESSGAFSRQALDAFCIKAL